jgi:heat shock protein HspQ
MIRRLPSKNHHLVALPVNAALVLLVSRLQKPIFRFMSTFFGPQEGEQAKSEVGRSTFFSPQAGRSVTAPSVAEARFAIGDVVRHRKHDFRGVVFDIDPVFANSEEWYEAIPQDLRPTREQPFYHIFAENEDSSYIAYVSQQNLIADGESGPVDHPSLEMIFGEFAGGRYPLHQSLSH